jgi:uncharacterized protein (DUF1697 family)
MMPDSDGATKAAHLRKGGEMTRRVAFLRAVNIGKRRVSNERLIKIVEALGGSEVWTHINSGNVVFDEGGPRQNIERALETALEKEFGFEVTTFVRSSAELRHALRLDPFNLRTEDTYFITFLKSAPSSRQRADLEALSNDFDSLVVDKAEVHWRMHGRSTDTKLPSKMWEKILGPRTSTSRNVTMLHKLLEKIEARR